jgi:hypothetical protein
VQELARINDVPAFYGHVIVRDLETADWPPPDQSGAKGNGQAIVLVSEASDHQPEIILALNDDDADLETLRSQWGDPVAVGQPLDIHFGAIEVRDILGSSLTEIPIADGPYSVTVFRRGEADLVQLAEEGLVDDTTVGVEKWLLLLSPST